jgi:glycerol uptake facilitator-like aquaporin
LAPDLIDESPQFVQTYAVKLPLIASCVRAIILTFNAAGPSLNPALATAWQLYTLSALPAMGDPFWLVYWLSSLGGALLATTAYALYGGCTLCGVRLRKQKAA